MIAAQLLTNPGDGLLFEDPGPFIARHLFESLGRRLVHAPDDADGMDFEATVAKDRQIRLAFAMPSRHHPLGRTLSFPRRLRLLDGVRPYRWTGSGGVFDRGAGVAVLELGGAEIAQGGM